MTNIRSIPTSPDEYDSDEENAFRGNLNLSLAEISRSISALAKGVGVEMSKTMQMVSPPGVPSGVPGLSDGDLDFEGDSGSGSVVLDSESLDIAGGTGITTSASGQALSVVIDDTAVTPGSYTNSSLTVDQQGRITSASSGTATSGTVTSVAGAGADGITVTGGPILTSGTLTVDLDDTAVTPGSYTHSSLTVDQQGRITSASSGTATSGTVTSVATGTGLTGGTITGAGTISATGTLADVAGLTPSDGKFIVGDGSDFVAESGGTARTSLGVGTGDSPQFTGVNVGHASDTTVTRASAGNLNVEGNLVYRAGGTDVPVTDGGTGASTAGAARTNLGFNSYLTAYRDFSLGFLARNISGFSVSSAQQVWVADGDIAGSSPSLSPWTSSVSSEWSDSATDGEFVYSGSDTRKFLITWHLNFWYFLKNQYTSLLGGVFLKPDGDTWPAAPIAGSAQISNLLYDYPLGLYYVYLKACSGGAVVEIENGDTVRFQFGFLCVNGTNTDGVVWLYGAGRTPTVISDAPGMSISIVPVT